MNTTRKLPGYESPPRWFVYAFLAGWFLFGVWAIGTLLLAAWHA